MQFQKFVLGPLQTNTYIIYSDSQREAIIIDPAEESNELLDFLKQKDLSLKSIYLTHTHYDHIKGIQFLFDNFQCQLYCHQEEKDFLSDPNLNLSLFFTENFSITIPAKTWIKPTTYLTLFDDIEMIVYHTPGHSPGSVVYYFPNQQLLFSGDTLFLGSVGRTDLPGGNSRILSGSLQLLKKEIPAKVKVFPGHGLNSVMESEIKNNPFLS